MREFHLTVRARVEPCAEYFVFPDKPERYRKLCANAARLHTHTRTHTTLQTLQSYLCVRVVYAEEAKAKARIRSARAAHLKCFLNNVNDAAHRARATRRDGGGFVRVCFLAHGTHTARKRAHERRARTVAQTRTHKMVMNAHVLRMRDQQTQRRSAGSLAMCAFVFVVVFFRPPFLLNGCASSASCASIGVHFCCSMRMRHATTATAAHLAAQWIAPPNMDTSHLI